MGRRSAERVRRRRRCGDYKSASAEKKSLCERKFTLKAPAGPEHRRVSIRTRSHTCAYTSAGTRNFLRSCVVLPFAASFAGFSEPVAPIAQTEPTLQRGALAGGVCLGYTRGMHPKMMQYAVKIKKTEAFRHRCGAWSSKPVDGRKVVCRFDSYTLPPP